MSARKDMTRNGGGWNNRTQKAKGANTTFQMHSLPLFKKYYAIYLVIIVQFQDFDFHTLVTSPAFGRVVACDG